MNPEKKNSPYEEKLRDPRWQRRRLEIMKANDFSCQLCGDKEEHLNVHHIHYESGREPWQYPDSSLQCLCDTCHKLHHIDQDKVSNYAQKHLLLKIQFRNIWETPFYSLKALRNYVKDYCPGKSDELTFLELKLKGELKTEYAKWKNHVKDALELFYANLKKTMKVQ